MQQLHQVRTARAPHLEPAASATEQSREEREQLRALRQHAFQRHQRNAAWMRELLHSPSTASDAESGSSGDASSDKQRQIEEEIAALKKSIAQTEEALAADHARHTELVAALRAIDSEAALAACRTRVHEESTRHAQTSAKEPKVIKL